MQEMLSFQQENDILALMQKTVSINDLKSLLALIIDESLDIVNAKECWIYLQPKYISEFIYFSLDKINTNKRADFVQQERDFIVLAATNRISGLSDTGKEYFVSGEGIAGWVYKTSHTLNISKASSEQTLRQIPPSLSEVNKYQIDNDFEKTEKLYPLLVVPLVLNNEPIGVLEYYQTINGDGYSKTAEELASIIGGSLASGVHNIYVQRQNRRTLMTLAHEINTPLTGILADSENIYNESPMDSELRMLAKHNLEQVLRLHMQTVTIMSVLSDQNPVRQFSEHSIYRPLIEACELFKSEALHKGTDIVGPVARDGGFPKIEMSLFDLTIALKNIIHNAVKYSFKPPENLSSHRTIKVWGQHDKEREGFYSVFVQNYGVEITQAEIETRLIFKPYMRGEKASDKRRVGAGFGLAHARMVIDDLHKGFIDVTSVHQRGDAFLTTFKISLPIKHPS